MATKKKRVKSKAAQMTADARAEREASRPGPASQTEGASHPEAVEWKGGGGVLSGMRAGFQSAVSADTGKKKNSWVNTVLWIAVIAAVAFVFMGKGS
jgi:hypothetical protein